MIEDDLNQPVPQYVVTLHVSFPELPCTGPKTLTPTTIIDLIRESGDKRVRYKVVGYDLGIIEEGCRETLEMAFGYIFVKVEKCH